MSLRKGLIIEGIASNPTKDVQGEVLDIDGADISPLQQARGYLNSDHSGHFEHLLGRIVDAKKIKALGDCETPTQVQYWDEVKKPFIWIKSELWDGCGHKEADAVASIYKFYQSKGEKPPIKLSVEGKTLERGPNGLLKRTVIKGVALTVHPANRTTRSDVVGIMKSSGADERLVKSEAVPDFIEVGDHDALERIHQLVVVARQLLRNAAERK